MKKIGLASLVMALLSGCSSPQVNWLQDSSAVISNITIGLKSNLWINQMPTANDSEIPLVHGTLRLDSSAILPANLTIDALMVQQRDKNWLVGSESLDLRTQSEDQWEVVFEWPMQLNVDKPVNVALQLSDGTTAQWLIEKSVFIDKVY